MNTANIKRYAPKARNAFIAAVTKQAARYGVTAQGIKPIEQRGDIALIGEQAFPKSAFQPRKALERRVEQLGFAQAMEQAAYSWFNRLCAIRYMEVHGYLDHGRRVLSAEKQSSADGDAGTPQILHDCLDIDLPGLDKQKVTDLKLDGTQDEELYRELLLAQCHALHEAMPFLFEAVDDATELLLPDNLTKTDSLIRELVSAIPEEDWQDVEIIGWLYQFYISEKKDQVIGKVVKSEDIPAATQLFTPNWIVQYLVQNSLGRQWLQTYPDSPLRSQMPYYIEPGEQSPEVQAQMAETIPASIDPESIKVLDPACGSGHILTEAYKVLKAIYEERGYRSRDIPQLILKHNLFGLDIDDRAGQLAGFALMMLAREDDRRLFSRVAEGDVTLNVLSLKETGHLDLPQLWRDLNLSGDWEQGSSQSLFESEQADLSTASADERYQLLERTLERFTEAKTFGSLIEVPEEEATSLKSLQDELERLALSGDSMQKSAAATLLPYVRQAWMLAQRYDAVIANPPYMGSKYQAPDVKKYLNDAYKGYETDLFSVFIIRNLALSKEGAQLGFMTPFVWMFISSYEQLRGKLINDEVISTLIQLEYSGFEGATVPICTFTLRKGHLNNYKGCFIRLSDFKGSENQGSKTLEAIRNRNCGWFYETQPDDFAKIPGSPIAYWVQSEAVQIFENYPLMVDKVIARQGLATADNDRFIRYWQEVSYDKMKIGASSREEAAASSAKWFPHNKGGKFRKWYGNQEWVINWEQDGRELFDFRPRSVIRSPDLYFKEGIGWSDITSSSNAFRFYPKGFVFDSAAPMAFYENYKTLLSICNNVFSSEMIKAINPTFHFRTGYFDVLPFPESLVKENSVLVQSLVDTHKWDWDLYERSWDFTKNPLISDDRGSISEVFRVFFEKCLKKANEVKVLEETNNSEFLVNAGLSDGFDKSVDIEKITMTTNPAYRYGVTDSDSGVVGRFQSDTLSELIGYSIGCMMGRYSLDKPGLILASQDEMLQDYLDQIPFPSFEPDENAILPLTDQEWFPDDATNRFREFVRVVWGDEHLEENLDFVAESLCLHAIKSKRGESALDTIRRYLSTQFYKDHLRTYKKRPIYWLFSSGKQKAFECLVYLHRYNESTLARMRTEYVIPLSAKLNAYAEKLEQDKDASTSTAETKRLEKEVATLHKQQTELAEFDEKLRHYADQRISLDLDDGVKVNYGKFGDLLAEVKTVTGEKPS